MSKSTNMSAGRKICLTGLVYLLTAFMPFTAYAQGVDERAIDKAIMIVLAAEKCENETVAQGAEIARMVIKNNRINVAWKDGNNGTWQADSALIERIGAEAAFIVRLSDKHTVKLLGIEQGTNKCHSISLNGLNG